MSFSISCDQTCLGVSPFPPESYTEMDVCRPAQACCLTTGPLVQQCTLLQVCLWSWQSMFHKKFLNVGHIGLSRTLSDKAPQFKSYFTPCSIDRTINTFNPVSNSVQIDVQTYHVKCSHIHSKWLHERDNTGTLLQTEQICRQSISCDLILHWALKTQFNEF